MSEPIRNFDTVRAATREWAGRMHGQQTWGDGKPYLEHLDAVEAVLVRFGYNKPKSLEHQSLRIAAYAHDLIEDTEITAERICWYLGPEVEALVVAVTNEEGKNRAERHLKTYPKIKATPGATALKLADRTANVEVSIETRSPLLEMYAKEHPAFVAALWVPDSPEQPMWDALSALLGPLKVPSGPAVEAEAPAAPQPAAGENQGNTAWIL